VIENVTDGVTKITLDGTVVLVDPYREIADDPGQVLPLGFNGARQESQQFRVTWVREDGVVQDVVARVSCERFARPAVGAPANAMAKLCP